MLDSEHAPGGVIVYYADGDEEFIHVNQYVVDLCECDDIDDFLEFTHGSFRGFVHRDDIGFAEDSIWGQVGKHDSFDHLYYRAQTKTGRIVNIDDYGRLVEAEGERPVFYVFIVEVEARGALDWLTGLPGTARFSSLAEMGAAAIRERGERPVVVALDLQGLKSFNAEYGRREGDVLICAFADLLRKHFGSEACSRFGEDHFYAICPEQGYSERIQRLFDDFRTANEGRVLPARAGVYVMDADEDIVGVGFDRAKTACDLDRKTWHSHLTVFSEEMRAAAQMRIHVIDRLDQAIAERWIRPYYQAMVRAATGQLCGEEALARWVDPEWGLLTPDKFVPVLEEAGLLHRLDMHIVDCVIEDLKIKLDLETAIVPVSVNVSLRDLGEVDLADEIARKLDNAGLSYELIRVEFTESAASDDPEGLKRQVEALQDKGFKVWMDDFGSGYSSLNMLQIYDFDLVKFDMEFVRNIQNDKAREIVAGAVRTARRMGICTLAEGVEDVEQALILESVGCDMLQGYLYSRPLPLETIMEHFRDGLGIVREDISELPYWETVGLADLIDPVSNVDGRAVDGSRISEFPAGVMELRGETWRLLRSNRAYREFLDRGGAIPLDKSNLEAIVFEKGVDPEYSVAAERSASSKMWERIAGRLEYGTGLQFYTKWIASMPGADAFIVASVPNMLGTALGTFGDVPVAYAVLRVILNDAGDEVVDAEYVYANEEYCNWCGYRKDGVPGSMFNQLSVGEGPLWLPFFYRAAVLGENVRDIMYSPEVGSDLVFSVTPSSVEGYCVYAFMAVNSK